MSRHWGAIPSRSIWLAVVAALFLSIGAAGDWYDPIRGVDYWKEDWRKRSIYQLQIDRFDTLNPELNECTALRDLTRYCGGTWAGLESRLDYLKGMNFEAIMLSPTVEQAPGGYHGYWPSDYYGVNQHFGTDQDLKRMTKKYEDAGVRVMMDIVANHVGYGDYSYFNPFNQPDDFHNCTGCGHYVYWDCSVPPNLTVWQNRNCRLAGLPDLDQNNTAVLEQLLDWIQWMRGEFGFSGIRIDALSNLDPWFGQRLTKAVGLFALGELPTASDRLAWALSPITEYMDLDVGLGLFDFLSIDPFRNVFYGQWRCFEGFGTPWNGLGNISCDYSKAMDPFRPLPLRSARRLHDVWQAFNDANIPQNFLGRFLDNADFQRICSIDPSLTVLRNALAHLFLQEGMPILYYGTEQNAGGIGPNLDDYQSREPLWITTGFDTANPTYRFIRMLNWYRWKLGIWDLHLIPLYVDDNFFAYSRGQNLVLIVTNGLAELPALVAMQNLTAGIKICGVHGIQGCYKADDQGRLLLNVTSHEPQLLVQQSYKRSEDFFWPLDARQVHWKPPLIVTCVTVAASAALALLVYYSGRLIIRRMVAARRIPPLPISRQNSSAPLRSQQSTTAPPSHQSSGSLTRLLRPLGMRRNTSFSQDTPFRAMSFTRDLFADNPEEGRAQSARARAAAVNFLPEDTASLQSRRASDTLSAATVARAMRAVAAAPAGARPQEETPDVFFDTLDTLEEEEIAAGAGAALTATVPIHESSMHLLETNAESSSGGLTRVRSLSQLHMTALSAEVDRESECEAVSAWQRVTNYTQELSQMELHVALEYTVPHLDHNNDLMYGGLGKMVDIFIRHSDRPIAVCAPVYKPFYAEDGKLDQLKPVLSFEVLVGNDRHKVSILATTLGDTVAFFLIQAEIFASRTRSTIYTFQTEEEQLTFFSVYNQSVAKVISAFGFHAVQMHDYHAGASLLYLPIKGRPKILYVAHNSDYNGIWPLGSKHRRQHLYSMLNLAITPDITRQLEHEGNINFIKVIVAQLMAFQQGHGVVAVSPRYATRIVRKFSVLWQLPPARVQGIINGIDGLPDPVGDVRALLNSKQEAKLEFQRKHDMAVGAEYQLMTFIGRLTHQKGSDLMAGAAHGILRANKTAQIAVAGPVGDRNGETARKLLEQVAKSFPGRVWNQAGQYIEGENKELLSKATDFFLCPSRFEPCGLTDIEFGRAGALIIGHDTGGLGKMPGFYFKEDLDNAEALAARLVQASTDALHASHHHKLGMVFDAVNREFPPGVMVEGYRKVWTEIEDFMLPPSKDKLVTEKESTTYNVLWQADNLPFQASGEKGISLKTLRSAVANLTLIFMQTALQLPAVFTFVFYLVTRNVGNIDYTADARRAWSNLGGEGFQVAFTLFIVYGVAGLLWQGVSLITRARTYLVLASLSFFIGSLGALWCTYIQQASFAVTLAAFALAPSSGPVIAYCFLDLNNRISVSNWGPALMGLSDGIRQIVMFVAMLVIFLNTGNEIAVRGYQIAAIVLLVMATWLVLFCGSRLLPQVYSYHTLRFKTQWRSLVFGRKTWYYLVIVSAIDAFLIVLVASAIYARAGEHLLHLYAMLFFATAAVAIILVAWVLTRQILHRIPILRQMRIIALLPGVMVAQMACALWGQKLVWIIIAGTVLQVGIVRVHIIGVLALHTLSSREMLAVVLSIQTLFGSIGIGLGGFVGYIVGLGTTSIYIDIGITGAFEAFANRVTMLW
ncbi:hypothetical protein WJX73_001548 [Symbiochloris irregularis]|uniref:Glycosyl hydrolase family 13 catalytic domain-containing protein n=1 Tax=Symbiochloris irregularis TaxID=706552 RepID=A0AAW1PWM5_9CHLO